MVAFFFAKGARNCSIVGAAFCCGLEVFEIVLLTEGLKKEGFRRLLFEQELQIHVVASLPTIRLVILGN